MMRACRGRCGAAAGEGEGGIQPIEQNAPAAEGTDGQEGDLINRSDGGRILAQRVQESTVHGVLCRVQVE